jgi:hypothetical protein
MKRARAKSGNVLAWKPALGGFSGHAHRQRRYASLGRKLRAIWTAAGSASGYAMDAGLALANVTLRIKGVLAGSARATAAKISYLFLALAFFFIGAFGFFLAGSL